MNGPAPTHGVRTRPVLSITEKSSEPMDDEMGVDGPSPTTARAASSQAALAGVLTVVGIRRS